jgi:hypothetical protein
MNANCPINLLFLAVLASAGAGLRPVAPEPHTTGIYGLFSDTAIHGASPLILRLTAEASSEQVKLSWQAAGGNTDHFVVETGSDGISFSSLAVVKATQGPRSYFFTQDMTPRGVHYYRLRVVGSDETFAFSEVVRATVGPKRTVAVFPNPSKGQITVSHPLGTGQEVLQVMDMNGAVVARKTVAPASIQTPFDLASLPKGAYQLIWLLGQETVSQKFLIQ